MQKATEMTQKRTREPMGKRTRGPYKKNQEREKGNQT